MLEEVRRPTGSYECVARGNNPRDVDFPRDALVAFTSVSGWGKSSLAFGTIYAEAQRRYFESVAPRARRLLNQAGYRRSTGRAAGTPSICSTNR